MKTEEFLEHMEFQPIKGKPTFDLDNLDNTFTQSKVEIVEGSWMFDLREVCTLEFRTSDTKFGSSKSLKKNHQPKKSKTNL